MNDGALVIANPVCDALLIVIDVFAVYETKKFTSCAFVARTTHEEPASPGVNTAPLTVHVPDTTVHETEPVPLPPEVVSDNAWPYVADVDDTDNAACATRLIINDPFVTVNA